MVKGFGDQANNAIENNHVPSALGQNKLEKAQAGVHHCKSRCWWGQGTQQQEKKVTLATCGQLEVKGPTGLDQGPQGHEVSTEVLGF